MKRLIYLFVAAFSVIAPSTRVNAEEVTLSIKWTINKANQNVVDILFAKNGKVIYAPVIAASSPAANEKDYFRMTGPEGEKVDFEVVKGQEREGKIGRITLVPKEAITKSGEYKVQFTPRSGTDPFLFPPGYTLDSDAAEKPVVLSVKDLEMNLGFLNSNKAIQSKISVLAGDSGPSISAKLSTGVDKWSDGQIWRAQALLDADVTYKPKDKNKYINSIIGEVDGLFVSPIPKGNFLNVRGVFESGLSSRVESDQDFKIVNATIGVTEWCAFQAPYIADFARALCIWGKYDGSPNTPILALNYDYVFGLKQDVPASDPAAQAGNNRLRGRFYWSLKVAHKIPMPIINLDYDASFLVDVGVIYDIDEAKLMPDNRLSLDLAPTVETSKIVPTITFAYVNGKTTPTFQHFDAFLAGLKIPF